MTFLSRPRTTGLATTSKMFVMGSNNLIRSTGLRPRRLLVLLTCAMCVMLPISYKLIEKSRLDSNALVSSLKPPLLSSSPYNITTVSDGCKGFNDDPFDATILNYFHLKPTISCKGGIPSIIKLHSLQDSINDNPTIKSETAVTYTLTFNWDKIERLNLTFDFCRYASLTRKDKVDDFNVNMSNWSQPFYRSIFIPTEIDHLLCQCLKGDKIVSQDYISVVREKPLTGEYLRRQYQLHVDTVKPLETMSIMMIGIDGMSKNNFARQMRDTKRFLLGEMGALELYKLNKIGENTFPNVMPLLAGLSLPDILRKGWDFNKYVDEIDHLFLWEDARRAGYKTNVLFDHRTVTAFHYEKKGWKRPKFYFYNRPVVVHSDLDKLWKKSNIYCVGDQPSISLYLEYFVQMARMCKNRDTPYFAYSFFAQLTHSDINMASSSDQIYLEVLRRLHDQRLLNNTVLVVFSDHGFRFNSFRSTFKGMLEDSNPFMFFVFPPWFKRKYPRLMNNFRVNQHRMVSHFDIHATLKDILYFHGDKMAVDRSKTIRDGDQDLRGMSLFGNIPSNRTCEQAGIPLEVCNCRIFTDEKIPETLSKNIASALLREVIRKTNEHRGKCRELKLNNIVNILIVISPVHLANLYQLTIETRPGRALYEAVVKTAYKDTHGEKASVLGDIRRVNLYHDQADCVHGSIVRPFCYCNHLKV